MQTAQTKFLTLAALSAIVFTKLWIAADMAPFLQTGAADSNLYVSRAFHFINGNAFGHYTDLLFFKLPGFSLFIALLRNIGIPYLVGLNILYLISGLYLFAGVRTTGVKLGFALLIFAFHALHPITFSFFWTVVMRESLEAVLVTFLIGSMLFLLEGAKSKRISIHGLIVFSLSLALAALMREEGKVFFSIIPLTAFFIWSYSRKKVFALAACAVPVLAFLVFDLSIRSFVKKHYGAPIVHQLSEGEFPKLFAKMRSIQNPTDNRYILVPFSSLKKIGQIEPTFLPVLKWFATRQLPGPSTEGCRVFGICDEITGASMPEFLMRAAYETGAATSLLGSEAYFRKIRNSISRACEEKYFNCEENGSGLFPYPHLKWTRPYVKNWIRAAQFIPRIEFAPLAEREGQTIELRTARIWKETLLSSEIDTQAVSDQFEKSVWLGFSELRRKKLKHELSYPDSTLTSQVEAKPSRKILSPVKRQRQRHWIATAYGYFSRPIIILGMLFLLIGWLKRLEIPSAVFATAVVLLAFLLIRVSALSYVGLFFGIQPRLYFSSHFILFFISSISLAYWARNVGELFQGLAKRTRFKTEVRQP